MGQGRRTSRPVVPILLAVLTILSVGCVPSDRPPSSHLRADTTELAETHSFRFPEDNRLIGLDSVSTLRGTSGRDTLFERAWTAEIQNDLVYVVPYGDRRRVVAYLAEDGTPASEGHTLPEGVRLDALESVPGGRLVGWDRRGGRLWFIRRGADPAEVRGRVGGNPKSWLQTVGDTAWITSTISGDYRTETRLRTVVGFTDEGQAAREVILPEVIYHDPSFVIFSASGSHRNLPRLRLVSWHPSAGLAWGENSEYDVYLRPPGAERPIRVSVAHSPVVLTDEERSWWRAKASEMPNGREQPYRTPESKPSYADFWWDDRGRLWVDRHTEGLRASQIGVPLRAGALPVVERPTYDLLDAESGYLGTVTLPPRTQILDVTGDRLLTATTYANEGHRVKYRIWRMRPLSG